MLILLFMLILSVYNWLALKNELSVSALSVWVAMT